MIIIFIILLLLLARISGKKVAPVGETEHKKRKWKPNSGQHINLLGGELVVLDPRFKL